LRCRILCGTLGANVSLYMIFESRVGLMHGSESSFLDKFFFVPVPNKVFFYLTFERPYWSLWAVPHSTKRKFGQHLLCQDDFIQPTPVVLGTVVGSSVRDFPTSHHPSECLSTFLMPCGKCQNRFQIQVERKRPR